MFTIRNNVITIIRGDTGKFTINILDIHKSAYSLEPGDSILFTVKKDTSDTAEILIQKSGTEIVLEPSDTKEIPYGVYKYDVEVTLANGDVNTIIPASDFIIMGEVTS